MVAMGSDVGDHMNKNEIDWQVQVATRQFKVIPKSWGESWVDYPNTDCCCGCVFIAHVMDISFGGDEKYSCKEYWPFPRSWVLVSKSTT